MGSPSVARGCTRKPERRTHQLPPGKGQDALITRLLGKLFVAESRFATGTAPSSLYPPGPCLRAYPIPRRLDSATAFGPLGGFVWPADGSLVHSGSSSYSSYYSASSPAVRGVFLSSFFALISARFFIVAAAAFPFHSPCGGKRRSPLPSGDDVILLGQIEHSFAYLFLSIRAQAAF